MGNGKQHRGTEAPKHPGTENQIIWGGPQIIKLCINIAVGFQCDAEPADNNNRATAPNKQQQQRTKIKWINKIKWFQWTSG